MAESEKREETETSEKSLPASEKPKPAEASVPPPPRDQEQEPSLADAGPRWLPLAFAVGLPTLLFFILPPLTRAGLWDPHELNVADLARRIAINLHGATQLALEGADNSLPHLNDLGRPQLAFTSIALGFKYFGLHEWAGRVPLALWGVVGVVVTYAFVARLVDRRAGLFSAIAMSTMPLVFVQARTMLGDIVTITAFTMAFGGLACAVFGRHEDEAEQGKELPGKIIAPVLVLTSALGALGLAAYGGTRDQKKRLAWFAVGWIGLLAGVYSRGSLIGYAAPALAIGLAYLVSVANGRRFDALAHTVAIVSLVGGLVSALGVIWYLGLDKNGTTVHALLLKDPSFDVKLVGAALRAPGKYPTFDFEVGHIASALAPWSAFVPFAMGRMLIAPKTASPSAFTRESEARVALLVGAGVAFVAHGWLAARTDMMAFCAPAVLAAGCGIALRDYERGAHPSVAVGVGTMVLLGLLHHELHRQPEKAFNAFAVPAGNAGTFPETFKNTSWLIWTAVLIGFACIAFVTFVERYKPVFVRIASFIGDTLDLPPRDPFDPKAYLRVLLALRDAWDGMLALAYFAMVAGASLAGLVVWIGTRQHAKWLPQLGTQMRDAVLNAWWATAFVPLLAIFGVFFWCDVWLWAFERSKPFGSGSVSRGFEPFEELAGRLKEPGLAGKIWDLLMGRLVVTKDKLDDGIGPTAALVLAPLMYLQVPIFVFFGLWLGAGLKWFIAVALAIPAGVALMLLLGFVGDLLRSSRPALLVSFAGVCGAVLCFAYYPALANQLSPKEVFESYQRLHKGNEPLALFGVGGKTAAYYAGGQPLNLRDANSAYEWLVSGEPKERHFLAVRSEELSRLNRAYRERSGKNENLPVLDARSSQIILVASSLHEDSGEKNDNPLNRIVLTAPPKPQRKLDVNLEDKLQVLGYDITNEKGQLVDHVSPGKKYHMKTYFKVLAPITTEWEMFIHIDGFHRRHNGDHKMCEGKYPMSLWLKDDIVMDDYEFTLEPNFSPGPYTNFFGLFVGDTRLKVKSGPADSDNRVNGGVLRVQ
jgi:4-amino-4-deoxy-L-arabinose transferase-like glycosyltransferase